MTRLAIALLLTWPSLCPSASARQSDKNARLHQELNESALDKRDPSGIAELGARREALGAAAPLVGLFLFDCAVAETLRKTLERIPDPVWDWLAEVEKLRGALSKGHQTASDAPYGASCQ